MDLSFSPAREGMAAAATPALPILRMEYSFASVDRELARDDVLAVLAFGGEATVDPRYLRIGLESARNPAPLEVWRGSGPVRSGCEGALRWSSDGNYAFVAIELPEAQFGGIAQATRAAYVQLGAWCRAAATPHLLRLWNYVDAINLGVEDDERYRLFCAGRAVGLQADAPAGFPAASAIGVRDGRRVLQVCALASREPGAGVENPRQISAWRYPRQYGPVAPGFARAMRAPTISPQLYISGTAAVVGHASHHLGDVTAQIEETLVNLESLRLAAGSRAPLGGEQSLLRVYVRHAADAELVRERLLARFGPNTPLLVLLGDICRAELLVEIDGVHAG